jgi:hypothetical protein
VYYKFGPTGTQQQQKKKSTPAAPPPMPSAFNYVPRGRRARRGSKILPMKEDARTSSTRKNLEDKVFEEHMAKLMRESSVPLRRCRHPFRRHPRLRIIRSQVPSRKRPREEELFKVSFKLTDFFFKVQESFIFHLFVSEQQQQHKSHDWCVFKNVF